MEKKKVSAGGAIIAFVSLASFFLPVAISGDWHWPEGWALAGIMLVFSVISRVLAARKNPDIIAERGNYLRAEGVKPWDKLIAPMIGTFLPLAALALYGIDKRFGLTPALPPAVEIAGLGAYLIGYGFSSWALVENKFFSSVVRIQTDRGHAVCDTGPYRFMRHPGYLGGLVAWIGMTLFVGSAWAFIVVALVMALTVIRTALEDAALRKELPGYEDFTKRTRYRLIPGIW
jgi:protein-S-isoprenylcysteine O-methyltransferase Ste14